MCTCCKQHCARNKQDIQKLVQNYLITYRRARGRIVPCTRFARLSAILHKRLHLVANIFTINTKCKNGGMIRSTKCDKPSHFAK